MYSVTIGVYDSYIIVSTYLPNGLIGPQMNINYNINFSIVYPMDKEGDNHHQRARL